MRKRYVCYRTTRAFLLLADSSSEDSQAINLLQNLLVTGSSTSQPAFVPAPNHLALVLTLAIHPSLNTRAKTPDLLKSSNQAIQYLQNLNRVVGPANSRLVEAFRFSNSNSTSRRSALGTARWRQAESPPEDQVDDHNTIHNDLAQEGSLFTRADDYWAAVGFAFNCSVVHQKRWERWRLWLSFTCSVLEDDWALAEAEDEEDDSYDRRNESLLAQFVLRKESVRRIIRAVFADGSTKSQNEFPELWKNEWRERQRKKDSMTLSTQLGKKAKVNIDEDEYGEFMFSSSSSLEGEDDAIPNADEDPCNHSPTPNTTLSSFPQGSLPLGGLPAIALRTRLLSLLSTASSSFPSTFISLQTLYDLALSHVRPLPLPTFLSLLTPNSLSPFAPDVASSFVQYIVRSLLEPSAPELSLDELDWGIVATAYAPFAAAGVGSGGVVGENGKVSGCIEALIGMLVREVGLMSRSNSQASQRSGEETVSKEKLWDAVQKGCERRLERAKKGGRRNRKGEAGAETDFEEERAVELVFLEGAWNRLRGVLGVEEDEM